MKTLKYINAFALSLPFLLGLLGFVDNVFWFFALLSTMVTGFLQMLVALLLLFWIPKNIHLYIYFFFTILFFVLWLGFEIEYWLFVLPALLAIYLTYILFNQKDTFHNHENAKTPNPGL